MTLIKEAINHKDKCYVAFTDYSGAHGCAAYILQMTSYNCVRFNKTRY